MFKRFNCSLCQMGSQSLAKGLPIIVKWANVLSRSSSMGLKCRVSFFFLFGSKSLENELRYISIIHIWIKMTVYTSVVYQKWFYICVKWVTIVISISKQAIHNIVNWIKICVTFLKELSFCHKLKFSNTYIFAT